MKSLSLCDQPQNLFIALTFSLDSFKYSTVKCYSPSNTICYPLKEYLSKSSSIIIDLTILSHKINIRLSNPANFRQFDCNGYWLF